MQKKDTGNLNSIRKEIQRTQLALIISITILLSLGGFSINIKFNKETLNQNLQNTAELITRIYSFTKNYDSQELQDYMDSVIKDLSDVDVVSIIGFPGIRGTSLSDNIKPSVKDANDNWRPDKKNSRQRIDGTLATLNAKTVMLRRWEDYRGILKNKRIGE